MSVPRESGGGIYLRAMPYCIEKVMVSNPETLGDAFFASAFRAKTTNALNWCGSHAKLP